MHSLLCALCTLAAPPFASLSATAPMDQVFVALPHSPSVQTHEGISSFLSGLNKLASASENGGVDGQAYLSTKTSWSKSRISRAMRRTARRCKPTACVSYQPSTPLLPQLAVKATQGLEKAHQVREVAGMVEKREICGQKGLVQTMAMSRPRMSTGPSKER
ncbi:hypothetical protein C8T65DRAFT_626773 [Cerioporus squamosus]|nr:hypothetical protein C8T65DRAFT_626773 [Cerioporus squamosus]